MMERLSRVSIWGYLCVSPLKVLRVGVLISPVLSVKRVIFDDPRLQYYL